MTDMLHNVQDNSDAPAPTALVMSSCVSASRVGATASAFCLRRLGVDALVLPTVLLGRHPGWGAPGGGPIDAAQLRSIWDGITAQKLRIDAVMTGYMASTDQVSLAADIITFVKTANPKAVILVDPVMGDHGRLYIAEPIAKAIRDSLLPLCDICTPNLWELEYITGADIKDVKDALAAASSLPCNTLITSAPFGPEIGAIYKEAHKAQALAVSHARFTSVPHGGGDSLAGTFLAHIVKGRSPREALAQSVASIFEIISHAALTDAGEMPLIREQDALIHAAPLTVREL